MDVRETRELVTSEYKARYPKWTDISVTEVVLDTFGGNLAVVRAITESGAENEEVCFAYPERTVRIFSTTEELARFLELKAKAPILERVFTRPVLSGMVLVGLLLGVFALGWRGGFDPQALAILGSVLGLAAGYFFGTSPRAS